VIYSIEILASEFPDVMGTYRHCTQFLVAQSCVHISEQDVGDLLVLTFGNCVLKV